MKILTILFISLLSTLAQADQEAQCLTENIIREARGESYSGMVAVAQVTLNRSESRRWPSSICSTVRQYKINKVGWRVCQFSWYCSDDVINVSSREIAMASTIANAVIDGDVRSAYPDIDHYYACKGPNKIEPPSWAKVYDFVARIDNHCFYRSN